MAKKRMRLVDQLGSEVKFFGGVLTTRKAIAVYMTGAGFDPRCIDLFAWAGVSVEPQGQHLATAGELASMG